MINEINVPIFSIIPDTPLDVFLNIRLQGILDKDIEVTIGSKTVLVDVSPAGRADLMLMKSQIDNGATSVIWFQSTGPVTLTPMEFQTIVNSVSSYMSSAMSVWQNAWKDIEDKKITTKIQIDSLQWPSRQF